MTSLMEKMIRRDIVYHVLVVQHVMLDNLAIIYKPALENSLGTQVK